MNNLGSYGVLVGCDARRRSRGMVIPFKRPATQHRAHPGSQNVLVIHGQPLKSQDFTFYERNRAGSLSDFGIVGGEYKSMLSFAS